MAIALRAAWDFAAGRRKSRQPEQRAGTFSLQAWLLQPILLEAHWPLGALRAFSNAFCRLASNCPSSSK